MKVKTDLTGVNDAKRSLLDMGTASHRQAPTMRALGESTARRVTGVPVDTGELSRSMVVLDSGPYWFAVGSHSDHARFVFRGTEKMDARPPKIPDVSHEAGARLSHNIMSAARR